MRRLALALLALTVSSNAFAAPVGPVPVVESAESPPKEKCISGEFIFADDGKIEMVGCTPAHSELLFLVSHEQMVVPLGDPKFFYFIRPGPRPFMCQVGRFADDDASCYPMQPVVRKHSDGVRVFRTMKGKFVSGRAFSMLSVEDQLATCAQHGRCADPD